MTIFGGDGRHEAGFDQRAGQAAGPLRMAFFELIKTARGKASCLQRCAVELQAFQKGHAAISIIRPSKRKRATDIERAG